MSSIASWFLGLSRLGKSAAIGFTALGGYTASAAIIPQPDTTQQQPAAIEQTHAPTKPTPKKPVVTEKIETEAVSLPFENTTVEESSLPSGQTRITQVGVAGSKTLTHTITLTDGRETDRQTSEEVTTQPVTQITAIGTYVAPPPPAPTASSSYGVVKLSRTNICHAPGTTYYNQTKNYTAYDSLDACLSAGGRMPKR